MSIRKWFGRTGKTVAAVVLSVAMAVPAMPYAAATGAAEAATIYYGDLDQNGEVDANDALRILQHVVKLSPITDETVLALADVNNDGKVNADDALRGLQVAVKLVKATEYTAETPSENPTSAPTPSASTAPKPTPSPTPSPTPKPTLTPVPPLPTVTPNPDLVVTGEPIVVEELNGAAYDEESGIYTFLDGENGMYAAYPFAGASELREVASECLTATAEPGYDLVWDLPGASKTAVGSGDIQWDVIDRRVAFFPVPRPGMQDPETGLVYEKGVTYPRPEYTKGMSFSFWAKSADPDGNDVAPVLTIIGSGFYATVKLNGTVQFADTSDIYNHLDNGSRINLPNQWVYYTVTIANDWITVYVNGQENLFTRLDITRDNISHFNDGFLTRYNSAAGMTEEDHAADIRGYHTLSTEWYYNTQYDQWMSHDRCSIFGNARYRGSNAGRTLLMDFLTRSSAELYIGGVDESWSVSNATHRMTYGTQVAQITAYAKELTAAEVASNYDAAKANVPADIPVPTATPEPTPTPTPTVDPSATPTPTPEPTPTPDLTKPVEGTKLNLSSTSRDKKYNATGTFTMDETSGIITFNQPVSVDTDGANYVGPIFEDLMKNNTKITQSFASAFEGQEMLPETTKDENGVDRQTVANNRYAVQSPRNNWDDVYYGPLYNWGVTLDASNILGYKDPIDWKAPGMQITKFPRPKWTTGASYSFWYKPTADESTEDAILTLYATNNYLFYMNVEGGVFFTSLQGGSGKDWQNNKEPFSDTSVQPYNAFVALGDPNAVKLGEWNYYTVTFANDMITTYINGKEVEYSRLNMNRGYLKNFNGGFLTRYNPIGLRFESIPYDDPHGYIKKSGHLQDAPETNLSTFHNEAADVISIRANAAYEGEFSDGIYHVLDPAKKKIGTLLTDFLSNSSTSKVVLGGYFEAPLTDEFTADMDADGNFIEGSGWKFEEFKNVKFSTTHKIPAGAQAYDLEFYECELAATQVAANYEAAQANAPQ